MAYDHPIARTLVQRIHNPHNRECGCLPECWCQRTAIGRAILLVVPGRYFGLSHHSVSREWKREQEHGGSSSE